MLNFDNMNLGQLLHASNLGDMNAQHSLAKRHANGSHGCKVDEDQAYKWFYESAIRGHTKSQFELARMYELGMSTYVDFVEATRWYCIAAKKDEEARQAFFRMMSEVHRRSNAKLEIEVYEVIRSPLRTSAAQSFPAPI